MPQKTLIISSGFIAGIPHRNPDLTVLSLGDELILQPEPDNAFDPSAIKILHKSSGIFLGYVPREQTPAVHQARTEGFEVFSKVTCIQPQTKWKEVGFACFVTFNLVS